MSKTTQSKNINRKCPWCGRDNPLDTHINKDVSPKDGDFSICIGCVGVSIYEDNCTKMRKADPEEIPDYLQKEVERMKNAISFVKSKSN